MASQKRWYRTRDLFPRTTAVWIQTRRAPHHTRLWILSTLGSPSLWTTSVMAGALGITLTLLLFVVGPPPEVALEPADASTSTERQPEATSDEPAPAPLIELAMSPGAFPLWWNEREQLLVQSQPTPPRVEFALLNNGWTPASAFPTSLAADSPNRYVDRAIVLASDSATLIHSSDRPAASPFVTPGTQTGVAVEKVWLSDGIQGDSLEYALIVSNQSLAAVEHVAVRDSVPNINEVVNVTPPAAVSPRGELVWEVGTMNAGDEVRLHVSLLPTETGAIQTISVADVQTSFGTVTQVSEPSVPEPVVMTPESEVTEPEAILPEPVLPAGIGDEPEPVPPPVSPEIAMPVPVDDDEPAVEVFPFANTEPPAVVPDEPASSVLPSERPAAIDSTEPPAVAMPVVPAEEPTADVFPFQQARPPVPRPEPLVNTAPPARPLLRVHSTSPEIVERGDVVTTVYEITNEGTAAAENVVLTVHLTDELLHRHGADVRHRVNRLEPGETIQARLLTRARDTGTATLDALLTLAGESSDSEMSYIQITTDGAAESDGDWGASETQIEEQTAAPYETLR